MIAVVNTEGADCGERLCSSVAAAVSFVGALEGGHGSAGAAH